MEFESPQHAAAILQAVRNIQTKKSVPPVIDDNFPQQAAFIRDESKRKALQCSRRAGKSFGIGRAQIHECMLVPGSPQLYIGLVRESARNIMWDPIYKRLNAELQLDGVTNETRLDITFPSLRGSKITIVGADASPKDMEKYLGGAYRSVVVDEAGSFRQDLRKLVYENMEPALADYDGWFGLAGTPTEITKGLFFDVVNGKEKGGWSIHKWNTLDNPYMREYWAKRLDMLIKNNPRIMETPAFKRMYLNEWHIDKDSLCYRYDSERNDIAALPNPDEMRNIIGVDLGFNDPTAFVVLSYSDHDPCCYIRHASKKAGMIISDVAARLNQLISKYDPLAIVIDNASKQAVEELKQKFGIPLIAAEKHGKAEFIEIMNSDFILGNIKVLPDAEILKTEYGALIWDKNKFPRKQEHPSCDNHCADAALYPYRYCYQYRWEERPEKPTEEQKIDIWFDEQARELDSEEKKEWWEKM